MKGTINSQEHSYIKQITYDHFEQRTAIKYGNNTVNTYTYDPKLRRLENMKTTPEHNERIAKMTFASVFPHYIKKVESKGRTKAELLEVIEWLTGFDEIKLNELIEEKVNFETFFNNANLNPKAELITGLICGYRIEELENPITKKARYLDKLVDELAKGRKMDKILRK